MNNDLISRSELKKAFDKWWGCNDIPTTVVEDIIDNAPTVEERPKGKWVKSKDGYTRCDQCGSRGSAIKARFCHHCGAEMKGGAE